MALTDLQKSVMHCLAKNRSDSSYVAGGLVLNRDWPRQSDDIDIFHDTDEQIVEAANRDIATLEENGFQVIVEVKIYGCVEARVRRTEMSETVIQWMSETRYRFFPIVRDEEWGARLHQVDLAINKIVAATSRTKARDYVDVVSIAEHMCPLGPLLVAAAGKPPYFSPLKSLEEIRRRGSSIPDEDYRAIKGSTKKNDPANQRAALIAALDQAEGYIRNVPPDAVGTISVDQAQCPVEIKSLEQPGITLRRPTAEPEVMPSPAATYDWEHTERHR